MKLDDFLNKPKDISFEEYEKYLKEREKKRKRLTVVSNKIFECEDAIEILNDEVGSPRYNEWLHRKRKLEKEKNQLIEDLL